jgi:hypothetical protein
LAFNLSLLRAKELSFPAIRKLRTQSQNGYSHFLDNINKLDFDKKMCKYLTSMYREGQVAVLPLVRLEKDEC